MALLSRTPQPAWGKKGFPSRDEAARAVSGATRERQHFRHGVAPLAG